ncbi:MAG: hypothetical protein IJY47_05660 [Clostridia bacterium]|nr:hypothetical protein [Clostridia bacterium]
MKKPLALLLALLMTTTVALAACSKEKDTDSNLDDDFDNEYNNVQTTDVESENESESGTETDTKKPVSSDWVDKNDVVYAGVDRLNLRTSASSSNNNNIAKTVDSGTKLNRASSNGTWSKVTLEGSTQVYYVSNAWLSSNAADFSYTACTPVALTINDTTNNIIFFESPFESDDSNLYFENAVCASGFKKENVKGEYTLKKVGTSASGSWIKVEFVGTIEINANNKKTFTSDNPGELYVKTRAIERGDISDPTYSSGSSSGGGRG